MGSGVQDLFSQVGSTFIDILGTTSEPQILYAIYVLAFLFAIFVIVDVAIEKREMFRGRKGKIISFLVAIVTVGSVFFGKSAEEAVTLFNSFFGLIIILIFGLGFIGGGIAGYYFLYHRDKKNETNKVNGTTALLILAIGIYIGTALLIPHFPTEPNLPAELGPNEKPCTGNKLSYMSDQSVDIYCFGVEDAFLAQVESTGVFTIFGEIFTFLNPLALLLMLGCLVKLGLDLLGDPTTPPGNKTSSATEDEKEREKEKKQLNKALNNLSKDIDQLNNLYEDKNELLHTLNNNVEKIKNQPSEENS